MKFEIKSRYSGEVMFSLGTDSLRLCVEAAVKSGADLSGANLTGAHLIGAHLIGAHLTGANLYGADLYGADLYGADLSGADLSGANLTGADLSGANLTGAHLTGANLTGAHLTGAHLTGARGFNKYLTTPLMMLYDQPGDIVAYKLVTETANGPTYPSLIYTIGETLEESDADTDEFVNCGQGLNIATLDWCMKGWRDGYHILRVKFTAKDIAAIPIATDGKFRVRKLTVLNEVDLAEIGLVEKVAVKS